jgi:polar amino acid transport system ATP-binding protein
MIRVVNLVKKFGDNLVIRGISLEAKASSATAIIGPSGGGKSTLLRCINGLEGFDGGEVHVGDLVLRPGTDARRDAALLRAVRQRVGMVFQQFNLFPHLSVIENLIEAPVHVLGEAPDEARARALKILDRVGLTHRIDAYPQSLSGGEQQRVAIARALLMRPEAILFDEPTSALDPVMANEVLHVMADLAKDHQAMIVVTHSMYFAREVADEVHVLANGQSVESGPPEQVLENPQHEITRGFLRAVGRLPAAPG